MPLWKLITALLLATCVCILLALRAPGASFLALVLSIVLSFVLNRQHWSQLNAPIPKKSRIWVIVFTVAFITAMLWQALYMPREFRQSLGETLTSLFVLGLLWILAVVAILLTWFRARNARPGSGQ
jgi:Na+-translocating ferredoxin:NAD+ oxidoreductase RnfE subunit